ncbi:MAG: DUF3768 domain-containing protein [Caulobacter sp.]
MDDADKRQRIRELNDHMRHGGPQVRPDQRWLVTTGVAALGADIAEEAINLVRSFASFSEDNDPHAEHDFGSFDLAGERILWKIDYYNRDLDGGSPDPADPAVTCRVLTVLLAIEY